MEPAVASSMFRPAATQRSGRSRRSFAGTISCWSAIDGLEINLCTNAPRGLASSRAVPFFDRRPFSVGAALFVGVLAMVFASRLTSTSAAAGTDWGAGIVAALPANAWEHSEVFIDSVSCSSAGNCSAVGYLRRRLREPRGAAVNRNGRQVGGRSRGEVARERLLEPGRLPRRHLVRLSGKLHGRWELRRQRTHRPGPTADGNGRHVGARIRGGDSLERLELYPGRRHRVGLVRLGRQLQRRRLLQQRLESFQGLLLTETAGTWSAGVEAVLPGNAATTPQQVSLASISCASPGNCSAVGSYDTGSWVSQGLLLTETSGSWAPGVEAALPANADPASPEAGLKSVSCASPGNCTAVGSYADHSSNKEGLLLTETAGGWATGVEASLPANAAMGTPRGAALFTQLSFLCLCRELHSRRHLLRQLRQRPGPASLRDRRHVGERARSGSAPGRFHHSAGSPALISLVFLGRQLWSRRQLRREHGGRRGAAGERDGGQLGHGSRGVLALECLADQLCLDEFGLVCCGR